MTTGTGTFGDIAELATALGVIGADGSISSAFFADPSGTMAGTLRDATRREALLHFLDDVLGESAPEVDEPGATWTPIFGLTDDVRLYLVTTQVATGVVLGVGVRGSTSGSPGAEGRLSLPLVLVPVTGAVTFLPGSSSADAVAELAVEVDVSSPGLQSVGLTAVIPVGSAASGDLTVTVTGLTVPGSSTPLDLSLGSGTAIGPQLLHVIGTLVEAELQAAAADIGTQAATLLGLFGLAPDSVVRLPLADLAVRGLPAMRDWLAQLAGSDAAVQAWFAHLAGLVGATPAGPSTAQLTLASGLELTLGLVVDTDDTGGQRFAPTVALSATVATDTAIELAATLCQVSTGAHPTVVGLPALECHARYGAASGSSTILATSVSGTPIAVGALRAGVGLDLSRRPVFVLAADRVVIGTAVHPTLDLTSPDALADVGGEALSSVLGNLISGLGTAGPSVSALLGLSVPSSWTAGGWPTIDAAALIANPVSAWLEFQGAIVALGTGAFAALLSSAADLLGKPVVANSAGTQADPWVVVSTGDLAMVAWTATAGASTVLHLGVRFAPAGSPLGGAQGPTSTFQLVVDALAMTLPTGAAAPDLHVLPAVSVSTALTAPTAQPVQIALGPVTITVPAASADLTWTTAGGASFSFDLPGATIAVGTTTAPLALPTIDGTGELVLPPGLDDNLLETLLAQLLAQAGATWPQALSAAFALGEQVSGGAAFSTLFSDPAGWLAARLRSVLTAADPTAVTAALGKLAAAAAAATGAVPSPTGTGTPDDPFLVPIQTGAGALDVAVWLDPAGPPIPPAVLAAALAPSSLSSWLDAAGAALSSDDLAQLLAAAAASVPGLGDLVSGRATLAAGWDALIARTTGGDGLLPGGAPDFAAATSASLPGVAQADLGAHLDLTSLAGLPVGGRVLYVTGPYVPPWFDGAVPTLDLTTAGLPDTAFDTSALAAGSGPWHVRLPFRDDCPGADAATRAQACAARLSRAIAAAGTDVLVVAHGPAAAGTAQLSVTGSPVAGLVLLGATPSPVPLDVLDQPPMADAVALGRRLLPADASTDTADLALARSVLTTLGSLFDATHDPTVDLNPPAGIGTPAGPVWSVRGAVDRPSLARALGALVRAGLSAFQPGTGDVDNPGAPAPAAPTAVRCGIQLHVPLPASVVTEDPAGISLDVTASLDLGGLPLAGGGPTIAPALRVDVEIYRQGGWLAGGPQGSAPAPGVLRTPSLRRAKLSVSTDLAAVARTARATITLLEGSALGVSSDAWVLGTGGDQLGPEARILLGRLASAMGPVPSSGPVAALADLLSAAGLADPTTPRPGFGLSVDALQQLLIDPASTLAAAFTGSAGRLAAADALRRLLGGTGSAGQIGFSAGGADVVADLAATPPTLSISTTGIVLGAGPALAGSVQIGLSGGWSGSLTLSTAAPSFGLPGLEVSSTGSAPTVALTFGVAPNGVPGRVVLFPPPTSGQIEGIASTALSAATAAGIRMLVAALRSDVLSVAQRDNLDPVLSSLGLLTRPTTSTAALPSAPFGLLGDPVGYLAHVTGWSTGTATAADAVATLLDGLRGVLGLGAAAHGVLPLTTSFSVSATAATSGGLRIALGYSGTEGELAATLDAGLTVLPAAVPVPNLDLAVGVTGNPARLQLGLVGPTLSVTLHTGSGTDLALLPAGPGLGSLATSAVQQALPFVLDALHDQLSGAIPAALAAVRDVLGLGTASFDGAQLQQLAANPGGELVRRLVAHGGTAFTELQAILPTLPAPWAVTADPTHLRVAFGAQWVELRSAGTPAAITLETSITADLPGITGASLTLDAVVDTTGLRSIVASGQVAPANALTIGPLSLAPVIEVAIGPAAAPPRIEVGLVVDAGGATRAALLSIGLSPVAVTLATKTNGTDDPVADPTVVVTQVLVPLVADAALHESHVHALLATAVGGTTLAGLLRGVLLTAGGDFDPGILAVDPSDLLKRLVTLIANVSAAAPPLALPDNLLLSFGDGGTKLGLAVTVDSGKRADLTSGGDIALAIEVDDSWVSPAVTPPGLSVMVIDTTAPGLFIPPVITVDGVGLRLYRRSGPLLDTGISVGSVGLFGLLKVAGGVTDGGLALQLSDLAIVPASATGGSNGVAQGILGNAGQSGGGGDNTGLKPTFSPELSLQKRSGNPDLEWGLTAGPGSGPWMLHIGRSFGPLRVDDVGFGDDITNNKVTAIRILISGGLSLAGLNLDVDELSIGAPWPSSNGPALTDPSAWSLDLAGLAVSYSGGGVELAGALRRRDNPSLPGNPPDYVGLLLAKVGPYGLTAFGGYGQFPSPTGKFTALFVFAAINAPIGGPPAFFVTGLGGGAGINRELVLPTELDDFASFPMIAALDPHSTLSDDPEHAMDLLSASFPPQQGTYWFAAGVSFTSFALVDVVAVVAIEVGDGFAVTLLGLARAALPTTYLPLVQLELALMAHFSTSEGIFEVRAQLTDNSYLLTRDCRLTGGFAYVSWFGSNPNAGQFVLSIGGYHPSFRRDDYPVVPRVGYRWDVLGCLTITGQSYFALTSEAIMVGTSFTAALNLGPLWASLGLGVDAIVYFDPFHFQASGYATIAAGITITIDLLFGSVTVSLSFHLGATVMVEGPDFHGSASIDLDVTSATISFGSSNDGSTPALGWDAFASKYLTGGGGKPVLSAAVRSGAITPGGGATPDGSAANPWLLVPEFSFSVVTTAGANHAAVTTGATDPVPLGGAGWTTANFSMDGGLAIAPMQIGGIDSWLGVSIVSADGAVMPVPAFTSDPAAQGISIALVTAPMPKGVWAAQLASGAIPTGETITAGGGLTVTISAEITPGSPAINYDQVEPGARQPLPFGIEATVRPVLDPDAANAAAFAAAAGFDATTLLATARGYLDSGELAPAMTPLANAAFRRDRVAPPRVALLTEGIAPPITAAPTLTPIVPVVTAPVDMTVLPPIVTAFLGGGAIGQQRQLLRTAAPAFSGSVTAAAAAVGIATQSGGSAADPRPRVPAPTLAAMTAGIDPALGARLTRTAPLAQPVVRLTTKAQRGGALQAVDGGPITRRAAAPLEASRLPVTTATVGSVLDAHEAALTGAGTTLRPGDVLVTTLPNHEHDIDPNAQRPTVSVAGDAAVRVVALSALGEVLADQTGDQLSLDLPAHTARLVAWCVGGTGAEPAGLSGWSATDRLPYVGAGVTLGRDSVVGGIAAPRRGHRNAQAGHVLVAAPSAAAQVVTTTLPASTSVVVVSFDASEAADLSGLTVGFTGVARTVGSDGQLSAPQLVSAHGRTHLVYDVTPGQAGALPSAAIVVTVGTDQNWHVAGVAGGVGTASSTAALLAAGGTAGLLAPLLRAPTGSASIRWSAPPDQVSITDRSFHAQSAAQGVH